MILPVAHVLSPAQISQILERLTDGRWQAGAATAGWHARLVKENEQLRADDPAHADLRAMVERVVRSNPVVAMATRPHRFGPILFSRYSGGQHYGSHVDDAVMAGIRTDISFTLFLAEPESYEGGELVMETTAGEVAFKLPAGSGLFYPSTTLHHVAPVTAGQRMAAVGWIRSMVRDAAEREILFDLDTARQALFQQSGKTPTFDLLSKSLANLLRKWVED